MSGASAFEIELVPEVARAARVVAVGAGNAGARALAVAIESGLEGVRALAAAPAWRQIGGGVEHLTLDRGDDAAGEALEGADLVVVVSVLGGSSGAELAPRLVACARERGALVVAAVAMPLALEGSRRVRRASAALRLVLGAAHATIPVDPSAVSSLDAITLGDARHAVDVTFHALVDAVAAGLDPLARASVTLEELRATWRGGTRLSVGRGVAAGHARAHEALGEALGALGEAALDEASAVLVNVTGGSDLRLHEANAVASALLEHVGPRTELLVSSRATPSADGALAVTLLADAPRASRAAERAGRPIEAAAPLAH